MAGNKRSIFEEVGPEAKPAEAPKGGMIDAGRGGARGAVRAWLAVLFALVVAMIAVGGLSEYAAGNRAKLVRFDKQTGRQREYAVRLGDLLKKGDTAANVMLMPGDVIIIPESTF